MTDSQSQAADNESRSRLRAFARASRPILLAVLGLGLAAAGAVAVFVTENGTGAAALMAVGALVVLLLAFGDRLESLRYGDVEVVLRRKASEAADRGDVDTAAVLERAADSLAGRVSRVASSYETVRRNLPSGPQRTARMEQIISEAASDAHAPDLDRQKVLSLLWTGSEGDRIWALGVLLERPELATTRAVLEAVLRPDQMFDQEKALRLAEAFVGLPATPLWARERIAKAVRAHVAAGELGKDDESHEAAERVLDLVRRRQPSDEVYRPAQE